MEREGWLASVDNVVDQLTLPEHAPMRARLAAEHGGEAEAACAMLGGHLRDAMGEAAQRLRALDAASAHADPKARSQAEGAARDLFERLGRMREALDIDAMKPVLERAALMSGSESLGAIESLDAARAAYGEAADRLAANARGEADFAAMREAPAMRAAVTDAEKAMRADSFYGPLLRCFDQRVRSSERAELLARVELYVESGHARRDCFDPLGAEASPAARRMRELFDARLDTVDPAMTPRQEKARAEAARNAIEARFGELFILMRVKKVAGDRGEDFSLELAGKDGAELSAKVSGLVDAAIRDVDDPRVLHCAMATASGDTAIEGDQVLRHARALTRAVEEGVFESRPATAGVDRVRLSFYSPTSLYASHDESRGARSALGDGLTKKTKDRLTPKEREAINALPYLSLFRRFGPGTGTGALRPGGLADVDLRLFGSGQPTWNEAMAAARAQATPEARDRFVVAAAAERLGAAIDAFAKIEAKPGEVLTSNEFLRSTLTAFADALGGVTRHGLSHPEALAPIQGRLGALRELRAKIEEGSPLRAEIGELAMRYGRAGGVRAWAEEFHRDAIASDAALRAGNAERDADLAATNAFAREFASGARDAASVAALGADVRADGWSTLGFEAKEAGELAAALDARARQLALNEGFLAAASRGDVGAARDLARRGADIEAVDAEGFGAGELSFANGHFAAAKALNRMVADSIDRRIVAARPRSAEASLAR